MSGPPPAYDGQYGQPYPTAPSAQTYPQGSQYAGTQYQQAPQPVHAASWPQAQQPVYASGYGATQWQAPAGQPYAAVVQQYPQQAGWQQPNAYAPGSQVIPGQPVVYTSYPDDRQRLLAEEDQRRRQQQLESEACCAGLATLCCLCCLLD